jgi:hypothetical protein
MAVHLNPPKKERKRPKGAGNPNEDHNAIDNTRKDAKHHCLNE